MSLKALGLLGVAAATLTASTFMTVQSADARPGFRGGGGGFAGRGFGGRGYYGGRGYGRGFGFGAAGLGAGLALGALASSSYGYGGYGGYGYGGGYGYYPASYYGGGGCYLQPRRVWGPYGWYVTRVQVCY